MKKVNAKVLIITCILCLLPIILGLVYYKQLPNNTIIHFDINHNPDKYFSKGTLVYKIPLLMALIQAIVCIVNDFINKKNNKKEISIVKWYVPLVTMIMYIMLIRYSIGRNINIPTITMIIIGIAAVITGIYLSKIKSFTKKLNSKSVKLMKSILILGGILCSVSILFTAKISIIILVVTLLASIAIYMKSNSKRKK